MTIRSACVLGWTLGVATLSLGCSGDVETLFGNTGGGGSGSGTAGEGGSGQGGGQGGGASDCVTPDDCTALDGVCSKGACFQGKCVTQLLADLAPCDDGSFCTVDDFCMQGACSPGAPRVCDPSSACSAAACDEATNSCVPTPGPNGAACDDLNPCTSGDVCMSGACSPGALIDCSDKSDTCHVGACDPLKGCIAVPANDGASCDSGVSDPCLSGQCTGGACVLMPSNEGAACDDGLFCTDDDACTNGICAGGSQHPCTGTGAGACFVGACDAATDACDIAPGNDGASCDDLDSCTSGSICSGGVCIAGAAAPDGTQCEDGLSCTMGESCSAGVCSGGTGGSGSIVYFTDSFADNQKGWQLGPEWQIGPAKASSGGSYGADPDVDHTPGGDNGVAGVVIGGNAEKKVHAYSYLESPPFDTTGSGQVLFSFYRWLNSDYDPYMHNIIHVWDGAQWVQLWKTGGQPAISDSPPKGAGWTYITHDITAYRSAATRIRVGFDVGNNQVFNIGSWNVDDVVVASAPCP